MTINPTKKYLIHVPKFVLPVALSAFLTGGEALARYAKFHGEPSAVRVAIQKRLPIDREHEDPHSEQGEDGEFDIEISSPGIVSTATVTRSTLGLIPPADYT